MAKALLSRSEKLISYSIDLSTDKSRIPRMSVAAAEASESIAANHQSVILENGKEESQETEEGYQETPVANGSEPEAVVLSKSETVDIHENPTKQVKEINAIQDTVAEAETISAVKLTKEEEVESKKQRAGTPQSRSSTPQRKSGRVRCKHDSPNKSVASSTLTPELKVLRINMSLSKNVTNGTTGGNKVKKVETAEADLPKSTDVKATNENDSVNPEAAIIKSENAISEGECSKSHAVDANSPYLRSLRLVSGRRSLSSNSPSKTITVASPGSSTASGTQWRKRQSRKKESTRAKDESEYQGIENEFNSSVGKRKAERDDDHGVEHPVSYVKKSKNEEDDFKLFLADDSEGNNHLANESEDFFNSSQYSKSSDDVLAELKDLSESDRSDDHFVTNEAMEYAYEAREIETSEKLHEIPTAADKSSNKRWCILM
ncbi:golgin subfamily A member 5-like isoform X2 [Hetaerina americana]|uniref:golgin subfamily A member 5-like isoform X2 n=1 Tax=Hetaerina americana TaxID=62018 RepID=UPI003A7F2F58